MGDFCCALTASACVLQLGNMRQTPFAESWHLDEGTKLLRANYLALVYAILLLHD
jgi:hypothetical protein